MLRQGKRWESGQTIPSEFYQPTIAKPSGSVTRASTDFDGTERAPMRLAEARITLGVVAARQGDIEEVVHYGDHALNGRRKSLQSLLMVGRDSPAFCGNAIHLNGQLRHISERFRASPSERLEPVVSIM